MIVTRGLVDGQGMITRGYTSLQKLAIGFREIIRSIAPIARKIAIKVAINE